jgi:uncharacterized membrane protein YbhN (UPF0104 family)
VNTVLLVHGGCLGLLLLNLVVRTWRTQVIFGGLGHPVAFADVATANLAGDAAAALTPLRVGGLPAQIAFFQRIGAPPQVTVPTLLVESILLYPVYAVLGGWLALTAGLEWLALLKSFSTTAGRLLTNVGGLFLLGWLLVLIVRRAAPTRSRMVGRSIKEGITLTRRMGWRVPALTVPLTVVDVLTRIALLPLLAFGVPGAPAANVLAIASFAMLYGQIAMPTPGGAGIVDMGLMGGAAGNLGSGAGDIVLWWRMYTVGVHMLLAGPALWWRLRLRRDAARRRAAARYDVTAD